MTPHTQKGFTLAEMIVVVAIFGILTSIVVFNYSKFTYETILTNMAYEVALSLREAQIYGVSVRGQSAAVGFETAYGIQFMNTAHSTYFLFADQNKDGKMPTTGGCTGECVSPYVLQRGVRITDIKMKISEGCPSRLSQGVSITFKRPNPEPIFSNSPQPVTHTQITLTAPNNSNRYVIVSNNGQVYVSHTPLC